MDPTLYTDLRCLQDPRYRVRGIGQHVAALLRARVQNKWFSKCKTIGLIDASAAALPDECASLVDETSYSSNPCCGGGPAIFIDGSPMTHDSRFTLRFQSNPDFFSAAVVYDFIPWEWPGYMETVPSRIHHLAKLARLRNFDLFLPISHYTAWGLTKWLGIPRERMSDRRLGTPVNL